MPEIFANREVLFFLVLVFITAVLMTLALTQPVFGSDATSLKKTRERIKGLMGSMAPETSSLLLQREREQLSAFGRWLYELPQIEHLGRILKQVESKTPAHRFASGCVLLAMVSLVVLAQFTLPLIAVFAFSLAAGYLPLALLIRKRNRRLDQFEEQLPEALSMMARAMRAGLPFGDALKTTGNEMQDPIGAELRTVFADINYGLGVKDGLLNMLTRVPSISLMTMVTAVLVQRETGGNLAEILEKISSVVRGRHKLRRRISSLSAEGRMSAWVLAMIPLGLGVLISLSSPTYLPLLLKDPIGQNMLWTALVGLCIGVFWMRRIISIRV